MPRSQAAAIAMYILMYEVTEIFVASGVARASRNERNSLVKGPLHGQV